MRKSILKYIVNMVSYTNRLILINVVLFFAFLIVFAVNKDAVNYVSLNASNIFAGKYLWTLFTSMFMHQGFLHLFVNMISLFFLGNLTEQIVGRKRFLTLYLIAGVVGAILFVMGVWFGGIIGTEAFGGMNDYAAGASGAIFGLLGILAVLIPRYRVYLVIGPLILIILEMVLLPFLPAGISGVFEIVFNVLILVSIFAMFSGNESFRRLAVPVGLPMWLAPIIAIVPLVIIGLFIALPIGNTAHLGGLIAGVVYGIALRLKYPKKIAFLESTFAM